MWVYGYDTETKAQSSEYRLKGEPRPKKVDRSRSKTKVLLTVFFDCRGIVHYEFLESGATVTAEYYRGVLQRLRESVRLKRPTLWNSKSWVLHHDNASSHTSWIVQSFLEKNNMPVFPQPAYSPDLAPCDFFLFPRLKNTLKGKRFETIEEIKQKSKTELKAIPAEEFKKCFYNWKERFHRCIQAGGNYFEGDTLNFDD